MFIAPFLFFKKRSTRYKRDNKFVFLVKIDKNFSLRLLLTTFLFALSSFILIRFILPFYPSLLCIYFCLSAFYTVNIPLPFFPFFNFLDIFYVCFIELLSSLPGSSHLYCSPLRIYSLYSLSKFWFILFYLLFIFFISLLCFST